MGDIGTLNTFVSGATALSADVNQNFDDIRTAFNDTGLKTDVTEVCTAPQDMPAGTSAAPGLYFGSDTDTGLYRIGADNLGLTAGGVQQYDVNGSRTLMRLSGMTAQDDQGNKTGSITLTLTQAWSKITLTGNVTISTMTAGQTGCGYYIDIYQDATGSRTITWAANVVWGDAGAPTLTTTASKGDTVFLLYDGTDFRGTLVWKGLA